MADAGQDYYRPYDSADESDSSNTDSEDSWYSSGSDQQLPPTKTNNGPPNFRAFASQIQLYKTGGPTFSTIKDQLAYGTDRIGKYTVFSQYDPPTPDLSGEDTYGRTRFTTADGDEVNIIMINSRFRDRQTYPQPTNFSIRLPRIYKNIKSINFAEIKLLTSFYYFRNSKHNTDITIYEQDRTTYTYENTIQSTIVKRYIREGSYSINSLITELTTQLNYTPLFFDYVNGFNDFIGLFKSTGDFFLNFNQPGDTFFNSRTQSFVPNPTITMIVTYYWNTRYAGLSSYTNNQALVAYYYPPLVEYINDPDYGNASLNLQSGIGIDPTITTTTAVLNRILHTFTGINPIDTVVLAVINANINILDKYRVEHTFRFYLVNKYIVGLEPQNQTVYITTDSVNTSLNNILTAQQTKYFNTALLQNNLTLAQYNALNTTVNQSLAILQSMYSFTQSNFLNYFAVPWSQYTLDYYARLDYAIQTRDGIGAVGIASNDSSALQQGVITYTSNIISLLQNNPVYNWPNLSNTSASTIFMINLSTVVSPSSTLNLVYDMNRSNFNSNTIIDSATNYFYTEYLTASLNAVCPIQAAKYTVFQFCSPVRQTLQIETLPRPSVYRLPTYNQLNFDSNINKYYNFGYSFSTFSKTYPYTPNNINYTYAFDNLPSTTLIQIPGWDQSASLSNSANYSWARSFTSSFDEQYTEGYELSVTTFNRALYFQFTTPEVENASINSNYTYGLNFSVQFYESKTSLSTMVVNTPCKFFLYHDRGGFQADVLNVRNETPYYYKYVTPIAASDVSQNIQFTAYPKQTYYGLLRPDSSNFGNIYPRVAPWFSSSFTTTPQSLSVAGLNPQTDICGNNFQSLIQTNFNYAQIYDSNWIQLPINSNLWPPDPTKNDGNTPIFTFETPIGYDTGGVSTDYTDYIPYYQYSSTITFSPTSNIGIDPITTYQFQSNSPYNSTTQTFLYDGGENFVFNPGLTGVYTPGLVSVRQIKIAHYYSVNYIPESDMNQQMPSNLISSDSNAQLPYTVSTTGSAIPGYTYGGGTLSTLQLDRGVLGFNFIPQEGVWDIKRFVFRSAIDNAAFDPNSNIQYIAVYNMASILQTATLNLTMSTAITVLSNTARVTYTSNITLETYGTDVKGGTYYEFQKDSNFVPDAILPILGYTQTPGTMSDQPESMYTAIAFNRYGSPTTMKALSGSAIPYPFYNSISTSSSYMDGTKSYYSNIGVIYPSSIGQTNWPFATSLSTLFAPPTGTSQTQSQYALSLPIGTTVLNYKESIPLFRDPYFVFPWTTTLTPTLIVGTIPNYLLLQDTTLQIFQYDSNSPNRVLTTPFANLSPDQIFTSFDGATFVAVTGNTSYYYFLGFSNYNNISNIIRLKRYDPITTILSDYPLDASFAVPIGGTIQSFTINDREQMVLSYQDMTNTSRFYYNINASTNMTSNTVSQSLGIGVRTVHAMDPQSSVCYWITMNSSGNGTTMYKWLLGGSFPGTAWTLSGTPASWSGLSVNTASTVGTSINDRVFFTSKELGYQSTLYYSSNWNTGTTTVQIARVSTVITTGTGSPVLGLSCGYNGGLWITTNGPNSVWGTRNTDPDINGLVSGAWQIFYPFQKIVLEKIENSYNPITDLAYLNYPEYPHTQMFYYSNATSFLNDTTKKWGQESKSNFMVSDVSYSGYYFNSYMFNVPVRKSASSTDYQYITIRGGSPTESSETLVRLVVPNKYDFGYASQNELIDEIDLYKIPSEQMNFNSRYAYVLSNFDIAYIQSNSYFGQNTIPNFQGSSINTSNFKEFSRSMSTIYGSYLATANTLQNITDTVNSNMLTYISTTLKYIFPPSAANRQNFTDPLTFQILWKSSLLPQYATLLEDWGLGYNLGYAKEDTPQYSTYTFATSFYKILEDYIYLRLNPEYKMNRIDGTFVENLQVTRDSTGQVDQYYGKLLLNNFNTYSTTFISNQAAFNPPIGRLETMYFEWVDVGGTQISDTQCEWTASLTITEAKKKATLGSTLPALPEMKPLRK